MSKISFSQLLGVGWSIVIFLNANGCDGFLAFPSSLSTNTNQRSSPSLSWPLKDDIHSLQNKPSVLRSTAASDQDSVEENGSGATSALTANAEDDNTVPSALDMPPANKFDLETALFCSGLAFDSYIEPESNSSRWERGVSISLTSFWTGCMLWHHSWLMFSCLCSTSFLFPI